jgi:hypothetical protein
MQPGRCLPWVGSALEIGGADAIFRDGFKGGIRDLAAGMNGR